MPAAAAAVTWLDALHRALLELEPVKTKSAVPKGFLYEQIAMATLTGLMVLAFLLQILRAETRLPKNRRITSSNIKWSLHRLGLLVMAILLAYSMDPWGVHRWYNMNVRFAFAVNAAAAVICMLIVLCYASMKAQREGFSLGREVFPIFYYYLFSFLGVMTFVVGNVTAFLGLSRNRWWYTGIFLLWNGVVVACMTCSFMAATYNVVSTLGSNVTSVSRRGSAQEAAQLSMLRTIKYKALAVLVVGAIGVVSLISDGIERTSDHSEPFNQPDITKWDALDPERTFIWLDIFASAVALWYSWMPLSAPERPSYSAVPASDSRNGSYRSHRSGSNY